MNSKHVLGIGLLASVLVSAVSFAKTDVGPDADQIFSANLEAEAKAAKTTVDMAKAIKKSMNRIASDLYHSRTPFESDLKRIGAVLDGGGPKTSLLYLSAMTLKPGDLKDRIDKAAWQSLKSSNPDEVAQAAHYISYFKPEGWKDAIQSSSILSDEYKAIFLR